MGWFQVGRPGLPVLIKVEPRRFALQFVSPVSERNCTKAIHRLDYLRHGDPLGLKMRHERLFLRQGVRRPDIAVVPLEKKLATVSLHARRGRERTG